MVEEGKQKAKGMTKCWRMSMAARCLLAAAAAAAAARRAFPIVALCGMRWAE